MNLVYNLEDQLYWINNFLPKKLYKEMYIDLIKHRNKLNFKKTEINWNTVNRDISEETESFNQEKNIHLDYFNRYHVFLKHQKFVNFLNCKFISHIRKCNYGQNLSWHDDSVFSSNGEEKRIYAATFYFNKTWGEDWGGEFMFKHKKNKHQNSGFIPVVGNSLILLKTGVLHKMNTVAKKNYSRLSIQTWIEK